MKKQILCASLAILLAWGGDAFAARTTRDLVFEDDEAEQQQTQPASGEVSGMQSIGVKTTVLLERGGQTSTVAPSHDFVSGDKVKLVFTPSIDGYVYWLSKGSSGKYAILYPNARAGMDNQVKRNVEYTVPAKGAFRFDTTAGKEELLCILSTERLTDLDNAVQEQFKKPTPTASREQINAAEPKQNQEQVKEQTSTAEPKQAQEQVSDTSSQVASREEKSARPQHTNFEIKIASLEKQHTAKRKRKTRDLVFEEEEEGDVSTKTQEAPKGEPFVAHYILNHN